MQISGEFGFNPRHMASKSVTVPGPNGAEPMLEFDLLREGLQVAAAFAVARDTEAGKAFDAFIGNRMSYLGDPNISPSRLPDPTIHTQARWNAIVRALYVAAADTK
jgi:hypothetical protein